MRGTGGSNEGHLVTVLHTIEISIYLIIHFEDPPYIKVLKHMSIVRILLMTLINPSLDSALNVLYESFENFRRNEVTGWAG